MQGLENTTGRWPPGTKAMTEDYVELDKTCGAEQYISSVLKRGNRLGLLASEALSVVGGVYAFAPADVRNLPLPALTQGGFQGHVDSYAALASVAERYLSEGASKIVIFEDALASVGDPCLEEPEASHLRVATCGAEVYYMLSSEDLGTRRVAETVAAGSYFSDHTVGLFSELTGVDLTPPIRLSPEDISAIVKGARLMVVGAFDGESFLRFSVLGKNPGQ